MLTDYQSNVDAIFESTQAIPHTQFQALQDKVLSLEHQLAHIMSALVKKETFANALTADLEHIILQLTRLKIIEDKG